jgi:hypothetical protein
MCDGRIEMVWKKIVGFGGGVRKLGPAYQGLPMHKGGEASISGVLEGSILALNGQDGGP